MIKDDTIQSSIHDFLLTFHSNHRPIAHHFRDKWRKSFENRQYFPPTRVFNAPLKGFAVELLSAQESEETRMMGLSDGQKRFKIGLAVLIQYRHVTDTQPATLP